MHDITPISTPIHIATVNGKPLRFFKSPIDGTDGRRSFCAALDRKPDLPWHSAGDLLVCMGLPRGLRNRRLRQLAECKERIITTPDGTALDLPHTRTVATNDGITMIAPESYARGSFDEFGSGENGDGWFGRELEDEYDVAARQALNKLTAELRIEDLVEWLKLACSRYRPGIIYRGNQHYLANPHLYGVNINLPPWWDAYKALEADPPRVSGWPPGPAAYDKAQYLAWIQSKWARADTPEKQEALRQYWRSTGGERWEFGITYKDAAKIKGFIPDISDYVDVVAS
jgi:hypothetical protein